MQAPFLPKKNTKKEKKRKNNIYDLNHYPLILTLSNQNTYYDPEFTDLHRLSTHKGGSKDILTNKGQFKGDCPFKYNIILNTVPEAGSSP